MPHSYPHFLIAGVMKAGTSTLYEHLASHPRVQPAIEKELHYFSRDILVGAFVNHLWGLEYHEMLNLEYASGKLVGEASPSYIDTLIVPRIHAFNPSCKIIISLREPVERAISQYRQYRGTGVESEGMQRLYDGHFASNPYVIDSTYANRVKEYLDTFGPDQVLLISFERFVREPQSTMDAVFLFLGLESIQVDTTVKLSETASFGDGPSFGADDEARARLEAHFRDIRGGVVKLIRTYRPHCYPASAEEFERY